MADCLNTLYVFCQWLTPGNRPVQALLAAAAAVPLSAHGSRLLCVAAGGLVVAAGGLVVALRCPAGCRNEEGPEHWLNQLYRTHASHTLAIALNVTKCLVCTAAP